MVSVGLGLGAERVFLILGELTVYQTCMNPLNGARKLTPYPLEKLLI
jgi:hypothetical protein